jgi:3-oxoacyl-[acyl-carrier protein] reductase
MGNLLGGKVALVTGATRLAGLGAAIADTLARAGADIGLGYFRAYDRQQPWGVKDSEPQALLAHLRALGVRAVGFEVDLSRPEGPTELFALVQEALGPIHILVNNAASSTVVRIEQLTGRRWIVTTR